MRRIGNFHNELAVTADGRAGSDMVAEIYQFLDFGVENVGKFPCLGIYLDALRTQRQGCLVTDCVYVHLKGLDFFPALERYLALITVDRLNRAMQAVVLTNELGDERVLGALV